MPLKKCIHFLLHFEKFFLYFIRNEIFFLFFKKKFNWLYFFRLLRIILRYLIIVSYEDFLNDIFFKHLTDSAQLFIKFLNL